jgi:hypothetical protein
VDEWGWTVNHILASSGSQTYRACPYPGAAVENVRSGEVPKKYISDINPWPPRNTADVILCGQNSEGEICIQSGSFGQIVLSIGQAQDLAMSLIGASNISIESRRSATRRPSASENTPKSFYERWIRPLLVGRSKIDGAKKPTEANS